MATPLGHALAGLVAGRWLRLRQPGELAAFVALATAPDIDLFVSLFVRGDPMTLHRRMGTHLPVAPLAAGVAGWLLARPGARARAAVIAAGGVGTHLATDWIILFPYPGSHSTGRVGWFRFIANVSLATLMDLATYGPLAVLALARLEEARRRDV